MNGSDALLKTRQLAQALGVSDSTIKRWVDLGVLRASRTVGKHRLVSMAEALRFAREQGLSSSGLEALDLAPEAPRQGIDDAGRDALTRALVAGDHRLARDLILGARADGGAVALVDEFLRPVMERIGHGWLVGTLDVYQEHQSSQVVASVLAELIEAAARRRSGPSPLALGAGPEGDLYTLSLLSAELVLREVGWDVRNLGSNLPVKSLAAATLQYRPRLVFLSVNHLTDAERFCREYRTFQQAAAKVGAAVVLGGRALGPDLRSRVVYSSFGERMAHLAEFARRMAPLAATDVLGTRGGSPPTRTMLEQT